MEVNFTVFLTRNHLLEMIPKLLKANKYDIVVLWRKVCVEATSTRRQHAKPYVYWYI